MLIRLVTRDGIVVMDPTPMEFLPNPDMIFDLAEGSFEVMHQPPRIKHEAQFDMSVRPVVTLAVAKIEPKIQPVMKVQEGPSKPITDAQSADEVFKQANETIQRVQDQAEARFGNAQLPKKKKR